MKFKITKPDFRMRPVGQQGQRIEVDLDTAIRHTINENPYDDSRQGVIEHVELKISNVSAMLAKIVQALADNGALTHDNVADLVGYPFVVEKGED
jgi:hypothetical protein